MKTVKSKSTKRLVCRRLTTTVLSSLLLTGLPAFHVQAEDSGFFNDIKENAVYTVETSLMGFVDDPGYEKANDDSFHLFGLASMESNGYFTDNFAFSYDIYVAGSTQSGEYEGAFRAPGTNDRNAAIVDFTTLFFNYVNDTIEVVAGKKIIESGYAELYSPTDRFGLMNGLQPMDPKEFGVWYAGLDYFVQDDVLSFKIAPFHEKSIIPTDESRWLGSSGDGDLIKLPAGTPPGNYTFEDEFYNENPENWSYSANYQGIREGYDFFGFVHYGPSIYTVLKKDQTDPLNYFKIDPKAWSLGGGYSHVISAWKLYGEGIAQFTENGEDEDFFRYTLGFSYRETTLANKLGMDEVTPILEFNGDERFSDQDAEGFASSSENSRPFQDTLSGRLDFQINNEWASTFGGVYDFSEEDWVLGLGVEYSPTDNWTITLQGSMFDGEDDTQFGRWQDNDNIMCSVEYKF